MALYSIEPSHRAQELVLHARGLLYAPGTFYSSIVPTVRLLAKQVAAMQGPRVFVANLIQECEQFTVASILQAFWHNMMQIRTDGTISRQQIEILITHVLVDKTHRYSQSLRPGDPIALNLEELRSLAQVEERLLADAEHLGLHLPKKLLEALEEVFVEQTTLMV